MVLRCAIHLEDESPYYVGGGVVSGVLVLSTTWSDKVYGISVKLASKVEVDWDASRLFNPYRTSRNEDVAFHSDCQILMNRNNDGEPSCLANLVSKRTIMITRGVVHRYPFLLKLPKDLPCSFNGTFGHVSYKLVVFIRKPFREMYIGATKSIQVAPLLDLNDQSVHFQLPVVDERKYFLSSARPGSSCRSRTPTPISPSASGGSSLYSRRNSSPAVPSSSSLNVDSDPHNEVVILRVRLPKTAFVPDQLIHFEVDLDNRSRLSLNGARAVLNANSYFQIDQSCKVDCRTLLRCLGPGVGPHGREIWTHSFPCPHVLPTGLGTGIVGAIDLQYFVQFDVIISENVTLSSIVKVIIGTVPFVESNLSSLMASSSSYYYHHHGITSSMSDEDYAMNFLLLPPPPEAGGRVSEEALRRRRRLEVESAKPPPSYDFHMRSAKLDVRTGTPELAETPPPSYEEAVSMSLSLLRMKKHHHHRNKKKCPKFEDRF